MDADEFIDHLRASHSQADAMLVCDKGVNGDDIIATMVASGIWKLEDGVDLVGGKRIRHLVRVEER